MMSPYLFEFLLQFIKYLLIFSGLYFLIKYLLDRWPKPVAPSTEPSYNPNLLTLRLQACERFVLYLERNNPPALVIRLNSQGLTAWQLQSLIVKTMREEFDYNLSQQLYISSALWDLIKNAKEESIALVNQAMAELNNESSADELIHSILNLTIQNKSMNTDLALRTLKKEADLVAKTGH